MKAVIQLVQNCTLTANGEAHSEIDNGLLVLIGITCDDTVKDAEILADRILKLRMIPDENDKINLSAMNTGAGIMVVSNFTLCADCSKSRRPDFFGSAKGDVARPIYEYFLKYIALRASELADEDSNFTIPHIEDGVFGADMKISFTADGPITILLDSEVFKK